MSSLANATSRKAWLGYGALLAMALATFVSVRWVGTHALSAAPLPRFGQPLFGQSVQHAAPEFLPHVLFALGIIVIVSRAVGFLFQRIEQPSVVGEVFAGLLLGPSFLGKLSPYAYHFLLPDNIAPALNVIAQIGVILFLFLVGLELDASHVRKQGHIALTISHASIVIPFVLGSVLSLWLYPRVSTRDVPFTVFALFLGVSMSITAFPVLARILTDRNMHNTQLGVLALTCAAIDDVTAWCLLALVVGIAQAHAGKALHTALWLSAYLVVMFTLVRRWVGYWVKRCEEKQSVDRNAVAAVVVMMMLSALATELIGIHALFGAFLFGALIPHGSRLAKELQNKLSDVVVVLFLPVFFAFTGMRTQLGLLSNLSGWGMCGLIVLVACLGKFGGGYLSSRWVGVDKRNAAALGALMNTRGLMELVVLNVGLDLRVVSPQLFAMMVVMALFTTFMTTPILRMLFPHGVGSSPTMESHR